MAWSVGMAAQSLVWEMLKSQNLMKPTLGLCLGTWVLQPWSRGRGRASVCLTAFVSAHSEPLSC